MATGCGSPIPAVGSGGPRARSARFSSLCPSPASVESGRRQGGDSGGPGRVPFPGGRIRASQCCICALPTAGGGGLPLPVVAVTPSPLVAWSNCEVGSCSQGPGIPWAPPQGYTSSTQCLVSPVKVTCENRRPRNTHSRSDAPRESRLLRFLSFDSSLDTTAAPPQGPTAITASQRIAAHRPRTSARFHVICTA